MKPAKVLLIEDDEMDRRAFLRLVRDQNLPWEVKVAETLAAARAQLAAFRFDVIVADNHLPDGNSPELFGEVPDVPFVLVTGTLEEELALRTLERGADDYLVKDPGRRYLEALPVAVDKTLYRKAIREREQRLTRQLRESEQRLRATFDNAASGIIETDREERLVAVNDRLCQMLGYTRGELLGMSVHDLTHPEDRPRSDGLNAQLQAGRLRTFEYEKRCLKRDGSPLWVQVAISAVHDDAGRYLYSVGTIVDISARKAAEAQVRLHAAALEAAPNAISLSKTDPTGTIVWVNPAFTKLTGFGAEEVVGQSHHILSSGRQNEAFYRDLWETISRGQLWRGELVNRRKDGTLYYEEMGIMPLRDEHGRITHYVAIKQDITERKQAEEALRQAKDELAHANEALERTVQERTAKLRETIGELEHFSYSITHDMRAPLRAMRSFASMLLAERGDILGPIHRGYLDRIATAAGRMDQLVIDALDYSKALRQELPLGPVDPEPLLRGMIESYPAFQPPQAHIQIDGPMPKVLANQAGLTQCFSNLLNNAVKFVAPGTVPRVRVWAEELRIADRGLRIEQGGAKEVGSAECGMTNGKSGEGRSRWVRIWFEDNGIGIPKDSQERIFAMFHQLSREHEGTGIGLAIVRKVTERMGGRVGVESEPGRGSRFWLELQRAGEG